MSETNKPYQPTCEDYPEDEEVPLARPKTTSKRTHSKSTSTTGKTPAPDTASVDSGYSSKTAATQDSGESGGASTKTLHPIKTNAPAAASLTPSRSASSDARRHSTSSTAQTAQPAHSPSKTPHQKHVPPPIYPAPHFAPAVAQVQQPMASASHRHCPECAYKAQQHAGQRYSPREIPMDIHHPHFAQRQDHPAPSPTGHFPPSSYGPQPRRRLPSGGFGRTRPYSYHEQLAPPPPPQPPPPQPQPPAAATAGHVPADYYHHHHHHHVNPSHHYFPPSGPQVPYHVAPELIRRPSTTAAAAGSAYAPPAYPHGQSPVPAPSPHGPTRPHLPHYDTEGAAHSSAMVQHMYGSAPRSHADGYLHQPQLSRTRRSTSPGNLGPRDRDRLLMPPPPPRLAVGVPRRSASTRRPRSSYEYYDDSFFYEDDYFYDDDDDDYGDEDRDRTIRARRPGSSRPTILGPHDDHHSSTTAVAPRPPPEQSRGRRRSSVGHRVLERERTADAEDHIARTSTRTKDPLTAERVKKINRNSLDSGSRSQKSRGGSERDGASSHISRGEGRTRIRINEDKSFDIEGDGTVRVLPQDDGNTQFIVENAGGREVKYYKDGSRASRTSNKSFASRASRNTRPGEPIQEGRAKSGSDKAARRKTKAEKPEVVVEDGEAREARE